MSASSDALSRLLAAAKPLIELALAEDVGPGDATSLATLEPGTQLHARIIAKAPGVIAGLPVVASVFCHVNPDIAFTACPGRSARDSRRVDRGCKRTRSKLTGSGAHGAQFPPADVRHRHRNPEDGRRRSHNRGHNTRHSQDRPRLSRSGQVRRTHGRGTNHRMSLYDMVLIKDNHIDGAGSITAAIGRARAAYPNLPIEVEVRDLDELRRSTAC